MASSSRKLFQFGETSPATGARGREAPCDSSRLEKPAPLGASSPSIHPSTADSDHVVRLLPGFEQNADLRETTAKRARTLFSEQQTATYVHTDRMFAVLMAVQWLAAVVAAYWISPYTWAGSSRQIHVHIWASIFLGGAISLFPILLVLKQPGRAANRYTIAVAQMLMSSLLIHVTGGRIETHFHVFGSLAFLAFYRDWRVLIPATLVVAADHLLRGLFWPQSVFGVLTVSQWRWLEHAGWVLFENLFLAMSCRRSQREMWSIAERTAQLDASEERYRSVVEQTGEAIFVCDPETKRVLSCNDAFASLLGYAPEELIGLGIYNFIADGHEAIDRRVDEMLTVREPLVAERRYRRRDHSLVDVEINLNVISYHGREALCCGVRDLTERRRAEEAARSSEEYRNLFRLASDAILILDPEDGVVLDVNDKACEIYAIPRETFVGRAFQEMSRGDGAERVRLQALLEGRGREFETVQFRGDGLPINVLVKSSVIEYHGRRAILSINRDITEHKLSEEKVRQSEERYRQLVENARDIIYTLDLEGRFTSLNRAGEQITGYAREEAIGRNFSDFVAPECRDQARRMILNNGRETGVAFAELEIISADGLRIPLEVNSRLILQDGAPVGVQGIARDITERRRANEALHRSESQLRQSQKMESIGTLAGGVAHDFNNLLTVISGNAQLAIARAPSEGPIRRRLEAVEDAASKAAKLTRQLLAFSRRQQLERERLNLNQTIASTMEMLGRIIGEDIAVSLHAASELTDIFADAGQIEQVIMNLVVNARDAMPGGGRLVLETHRLTLDADYCRRHPYARPGRYARLMVSDSGVGMDAETRARIFEPFFTTKEVGRGTGLGLAMVYGIVKQHGGHIEVYSEPGHGTTFKVYFPLGGAPVETPAPREPSVLSRGTETILVAEDEAALRELSRDILEGLGYTVLLARDGREAVEMYRAAADRIDLLMLDVVMPRTSGYEAYEQMRAAGSDQPLIFMTGYSPEMIENKYATTMGAALIQKPYTVEALGHKVREVLDRRPRGKTPEPPRDVEPSLELHEA